MILVMGVFELEIDPIRRLMMKLETGELLKRPFTRGVVGPNEVVTIYGFVGKVEAAMMTQAALDRFKPSAVIFTGAVGALSNFLKLGDIVIGDEYLEYDLGRRDGKVEVIEGSERLIEKLESYIEGAVVGKIATGDSFISDPDTRDEIRRLTRSIAVDMDSAAVAKVCKENGVEFVAVKTVVDVCDVEEFASNYERFASKSATLVLGLLYEHII